MISPEIDKLYKYFSYNTNSLAVLINKVFWASKPECFNDPFDCGIKLLHEMNPKSALIFIRDYLRYNPSLEKINRTQASDTELILAGLKKIDSINLSQNLLEKVSEVISDLVDKAVQNSGVISFSETNDNILMWSHYANQHYGFCLELKRSKNNSLGSNRTLPVIYPEKMPLISAKLLGGGTKEERNKIRQSLMLTKAKDWDYEKEWRYVIERKGNSCIKLNTKIVSVIFGLRMRFDQRKTVYEILRKDKSMNFKETKKVEGGFGLEIIELEKSYFCT